MPSLADAGGACNSSAPQAPLFQLCAGGGFTVTGDCSQPLKVDCSHKSQDSTVAVVTALWPLRTDRAEAVWKSWLSETHRLNAPMLSFLPAPYDTHIRHLRVSRGLAHQTCIVSLHGTGAIHLPFGYLTSEVRHMLTHVRDGALRDWYSGWNWNSPEMSNERYVLLQASKLVMLEAARVLRVFPGAKSFVWVDAGLGRHVSIPSTRWPDERVLSALPSGKLHIGTWDGYKPIGKELSHFCKRPAAELRVNRNHLSGTVIVAGKDALPALLPVWRLALEGMIRTGQWNNEQVLLELLACFFPDRIAFIESRGVLFKQLGDSTMPPHSVSAGISRASPADFCQLWATPLVPAVAFRPAQLLILGTHASGTTKVTDLLGTLGVSITGRERTTLRANATKAVEEVNRRMLALGGAQESSGMGFSRVTLDAALMGDGGLVDLEMREMMRAAIDSLDNSASHGGFPAWALGGSPRAAWTLGSPRAASMVPLWRRVLSSPVCVLVFRNPTDVVGSWRGNQSRNSSLELWAQYNTEVMTSCTNVRTVVIEYEALRDQPEHAIARLLDDLREVGVRGMNVTAATDKVLRQFRYPEQPAQERHVDPSAAALHRTLQMRTAPLVVSAFVELPRHSVKHGYSFNHSLRVPADYIIFCSPVSTCEHLHTVREKDGFSTEIVPMTMQAVGEQLASTIGVSPGELWAAANASRYPGHCPSAELVILWLAKPLFVQLAMSLHPERTSFAWVDAGFAEYELVQPSDPPMPPWHLAAGSGFWPRDALAVRWLRAERTCHNSLRGIEHKRCIVGTFMYGARSQWHRQATAFGLRVQELVQSRQSWAKDRKRMLCLDQDVLADIAVAQPSLFDGFVTSSDWGWGDARRPLETKSRGTKPHVTGTPASKTTTTTEAAAPHDGGRAGRRKVGPHSLLPPHRSASTLLTSCSAERPIHFGKASARHGIFSLLTRDLHANDTYVQSLRVLGASFEVHASALPRYIMALETVRVERTTLTALAQVGWRVCSVPGIMPPHPSSEPRFREQFAKLELLRFEQFDRVLYVDADVLALAPVAPILEVQMHDAVHLAATRDMRGTPYDWADTFNCGVMVLRPNATEYDRLIGMLQRDEVTYEFVMSEQGFLNQVYSGERAARLPFVDGANLVVMNEFKREWEEAFPRIRLLHYTMSKPWACQRAYMPACLPWLSTKAALEARWQPSSSWCDRVRLERAAVKPQLRIAYPCASLAHVESAVVTLLTDNLKDGPGTFGLDKYVMGALALGMSLRKHITRPVHRLLLVREGLSLSNADVQRLKAVGWTLGTVPTVTPPTLPSFRRFRSQFSKLALFGLTEYKSVLHLDADALAVAPLERLLDSSALFPEPDKRLAVARDFYGEKWSSTFNMGVFALRPSTRELTRLHGVLFGKHFAYNVEQSEQGFMNAIYPMGDSRLTLLPFEASGNSALEVRAPEFWAARLDRLVLIHFTERKAWQCKEAGPPLEHTARTTRSMACGDGFSAPHSDTACYCREAYRWWAMLRQAEDLAKLYGGLGMRQAQDVRREEFHAPSRAKPSEQRVTRSAKRGDTVKPPGSVTRRDRKG